MKDERTPSDLMAAAMGGEAGMRRQRSKNVASWRQGAATGTAKGDVTPASARTVPMFPKGPPQQIPLPLGFLLDSHVPAKASAPPCSCGKFVSWRRRPDGNEYCNACGRWQGWETRAPFAGVTSIIPAQAKVAKATKAPQKPAAPHGDKAKKPSALKGIKKAPPGDVWWVSEAWSKAFEYRATLRRMAGPNHPETEPEHVEFIMFGMQIETGVGNQGSKGAMYAHAAREAKRRQQAFLTTRSKCQQFVGWPVRVTLTRVSPSEFDDDNLGNAFKRIRDGICEALGFRDDKNRVGYLQWHSAQEKGGSRKSRTNAAVAHVKVRVEVLR